MLKEIISGWGNYIFKSAKVEAVAIERAKICAVCSHAKRMNVLEFLHDDVKQIEAIACELCTCPLSTKLRSPNAQCDLGKW